MSNTPPVKLVWQKLKPLVFVSLRIGRFLHEEPLARVVFFSAVRVLSPLWPRLGVMRFLAAPNCVSFVSFLQRLYFYLLSHFESQVWLPEAPSSLSLFCGLRIHQRLLLFFQLTQLRFPLCRLRCPAISIFFFLEWYFGFGNILSARIQTLFIVRFLRRRLTVYPLGFELIIK